MWFRSTIDLLSSRTARQSRHRTTPWRLRLEPLEDRRLLSLTPAVNYDVAASPIDLAIGDFDGDNVPDMATINATQLSLLMGNGDGTFQAAQTTSVGSGLRSLATGHFDADGRLDLAMTSSVTTLIGSVYVTEGFINVLLNNGTDGSGNVVFQPVRTFGTGANTTPGAIAVGDLNGDGQLDVATAQADGSNVTVLLGNGDGNLQTGRDFAVGGSDPASVAVGDINADGKLDLVTANRGSNNVGVLINSGNDSTGNVTFQSARNTALNGRAEGVAVGDFDANGKLDLAVTSSVPYYGSWGYYGYYGQYGNNGYVNVLLGNGDGTFVIASTTWLNNSRVGEVAAADFNGDGKLDVVTPEGFQATAVDPILLLGRGDGTFDVPYHFDAGYGPVAVVAADLNGDATPDVGVANSWSASVSVLLNDNDWPPLGAPLVSIGDAWVVEGDTGTKNAVFTVSLSAAFNQPVSVQYSTADGTATAGSDYQTRSGTLTFNPGGSLSQTVSVPVIGDRVLEPYSDSFYVNLSAASDVRIQDGQGTGWINDDEPAAYVSSLQIVEGHAGAADAVFTVSTASSNEQLIVNWSTGDGTARAGSDYQASSGTLTFQSGGPLTQNVSVPVYGDRLGEGYEFFYLTLANGYSGQGYILDDEPLFNINGAFATEAYTGTTSAVFTVSLSQAYDQPVSVNFSTAEGDTEFPGGSTGYYGYYGTPPATSGSDFEAQTGTLTFALGETSKTINVAVYGDRHAEATESFSVDLSNPSANATLGRGHGLGNIADDEPLITISSSQVVEGNTGTTDMLFIVSLEGASDGPVTVDWSTVDDYYWGGATAGNDYQASSGTVTFELGGPLTQTIAVPVIGDRLFEYSEFFPVALGNGSWWGSGMILDDEPLISISDAAVDEGDTGTTSAVFTVSLTQVYDEPVTVNFSTAEGPYYAPAATPGSDFQSQSGSVTIAAGQTSATISVAVYGDTLIEETEYFSVILTAASANAAISDGYAVGAILDDDVPPTKFYVVDASSDKTFEYAAAGESVENYTLRSGNNAPRGAASDASGQRVWVIDNDDYVYVYDAAGNSLGAWKANGLQTPEGIASNGTDIWIVDRNRDRVYRYAGAASRTSGSASPTSSFALNSGNKEARGIETDGTHLWVVNDASTNKVFKYTLSGALVGSWTISGANTTPTGITLDPSNPSDIWIVDAGRDQVFQYTAAASRTSGSQAPSAVFNLASGNTNPQGIADPPPPAGQAASLTPSNTPAEPSRTAGAQNPTRFAGPTATRDGLLAPSAAPGPARLAGPTASAETPLILPRRPIVSAASTVAFADGETILEVASVRKKKEKHEYFNFNLFNAYDAVFADAERLGDILNDDQR